MRDLKIVARLFGGLGNQLFIYAAARRLALTNQAELIVDDVNGFRRDKHYKRHYQLDHFNISCRRATADERLEPFARIRSALMRRLNRWKPFLARSYLFQEIIEFDPRLLNFKPSGTTYLEGYWQSENYFKDVEATIRKDLKIIPPTDSINLSVAESIQKCEAVALHVRFFDGVIDEEGNNAPTDYYSRALLEIERRVHGAHYFIFSDMPEAARIRISLPDSRVTFVTHNKGDANAYADLWLMTLCKHFIIANSTFSWWGAWLGKNPGKIVIAPGYEKRDGVMWWGFDGLLPEEWVKL